MSAEKPRGRWWERLLGFEASPDVTVVATAPSSPATKPALPGFGVITRHTTGKAEVARGGMNVVHHVFDDILLRDIALKTVRKELRDDRTVLTRFIEEAQITSQLDHPNIPPVHALGEDLKGNYCFTMKLVRGCTLLDLIESDSYAPDDPAVLADILDIFIKVCDAVAFAHSRGVIHCDIKPTNVMIGHFGQVYLMDWGIARLKSGHGAGRGTVDEIKLEQDSQSTYREGERTGTPSYMAPEQARGEHDMIDERTDVFGLGALMYHLLTSQPPYTGANPGEVLLKAANASIMPPTEAAPDRRLPPRLCQIVMDAMAPTRDGRHESVAALRDALAGVARGDDLFPRRAVKAGEVIIREGDPPDNAYVIVKGRFRVTKRSRLKASLGPGDVFGETAFFSDKERVATVEATEDGMLAVVDGESLERELGKATLLAPFVQQLARTFGRIDAELDTHRVERATGALYQELLLYMAFDGERKGGEVVTAPFGPLVDRLVPDFAESEAALLKTLAGFGTVHVDAEQDLITLMALTPVHARRF